MISSKMQFNYWRIPAMFRTAEDLVESGNDFYAILQGDDPVGVIEVCLEDGLLDIWSLGVEPGLRRHGIGRRLLSHVLDNLVYDSVVVRTAAVNQPAISLYQQFGFREYHLVFERFRRSVMEVSAGFQRMQVG